MIRRFLWGVIGCILVCSPTSRAGEPVAPTPTEYAAVFEVLDTLFDQSDEALNLAEAKLAIDKIIDPSIDVEWAVARIDSMVRALQTGLVADLQPLDKALSLSAFLYESGIWNDFRPFRYDFSDPMGQRLDNKLLNSYLLTKKGNCITMPMLYLILADRIGLDVSLATAPLHVYVVLRDRDSGRLFNIETTDMGKVTDDHFYLQQSSMTDLAITNGVYLRPLSKREVLAVMSILLSEHFAAQGQWQLSIDIAQRVLTHYPNYVYAMLKKGNGYRGLIAQKLTNIDVLGNGYSQEDRQLVEHWHQQNRHWFAEAEALGWKRVSAEENVSYMNRIQQQSTSLNHSSKGS